MEHSLEKPLIMIVCGSTRIHYWELVCREGSGGAEKRERSLRSISFLQVLIHGIYLQNPKSLALPD